MSPFINCLYYFLYKSGQLGGLPVTKKGRRERRRAGSRRQPDPSGGRGGDVNRPGLRMTPKIDGINSRCKWPIGLVAGVLQ